MSATIKDIAKKVGVNPSTVSRVINGTASISEETRQKIKEAMQELDYHPNSLARSLVNGSTFTIGLVIDAGNTDAFSNTFFIRSVSAIEAVTQEKGFNLLITSDKHCENENTVKNLILERKIDGIILPVSAATQELLEILLQNQFPFIVMGEPESAKEGIHWIDMDNRQGSRDAVAFLFRQGYQKPLLLVENTRAMFELNRIRGFQDGLEAQKQDNKETYIAECGVGKKQVQDTIAGLLDANPDADSIICTNNTVAYYALQELKKRKKKIPKDFGLVTFDNYPLAEYMEPPLTTVDVDTYKLGEEAAVQLFSIIGSRQSDKKEGKKGEAKLLPTQLIARKSTQK